MAIQQAFHCREQRAARNHPDWRSQTAGLPGHAWAREATSGPAI